MTKENPVLSTRDGRLARIEDFLIKVNTKLDRIEQAQSRLAAVVKLLEMKLGKPDGCQRR